MEALYPAQFGETIAGAFGAEGRAWLGRLPRLLEAFSERWGLSQVEPVELLSYNYVCRARRGDGQAAVLKLGVPNPELSSEIEALRLYDGRGAARLLECEAEAGALLLERVEPGVMLARLEDDDQASLIAAGVLERLWRPAPESEALLSAAGWAEGIGRLRQRFEGGTGPLDETLVERAERAFSELLGSTQERTLLHGDFHHYNILQASREPWLAIDPKGVVGERAYELGALLYNPLGFPQRADLGRRLRRRVDLLCERLGLERERVIGYGLAQAVLSACWSVEANERGWEGVMRAAEVMGRMGEGRGI